MKVAINFSKEKLDKKPELTGVRSAHLPTRPQQPRPGSAKFPKKPFSIKKVLTASIIGFTLVVVMGYVEHFPTAVMVVDYVRNPTFAVTKAVYPQFSYSYTSTVNDADRLKVDEILRKIEFDGKKRFSVNTGTDVTIQYTTTLDKDDTVLSTDYAIPVGHLYWIRDTVSTDNIVKDGAYAAESKADLYSKILSEASGKTITVKGSKDLPATLQSNESLVGFVSFSELGGQYKVLSLNGSTFLDSAPKGAIQYYLVARGKSELAKSIMKSRLASTFQQEPDFTQILTLRMTGVTAISRSLGIKTNASGDPAYAARKIGDFLSKADLTHVSNEVSFKDGCIMGGGMSFCAVPSYIEALKKSGVDIVELTGNHNNDAGTKWNTSTINTYNSLGWGHFGGGLDGTDAAKILYENVKGSKIAFLGYDYYDTVYGNPEIAGNNHPGANSWSLAKAAADIAAAKKEGAFVIVDIQYQECWAYTDNGSTVQSCYAPIGSPNQKADFRSVIDAGADMVIGTQAHQVQTYEIYKGKPIYYGLGNLFFDQTQQLGTRQGIILTHYYYQGKYLGTQLTTTIYDADLLTYITTGDQRTKLLNSLKTARP